MTFGTGRAQYFGNLFMENVPDLCELHLFNRFVTKFNECSATYLTLVRKFLNMNSIHLWVDLSIGSRRLRCGLSAIDSFFASAIK